MVACANLLNEIVVGNKRPDFTNARVTTSGATLLNGLL